MLHRRSVLTGLVAAFAAPAIVRASSIMPVRALAPELLHSPVVWESGPWRVTEEYGRPAVVDCTFLPSDYVDPICDDPIEIHRRIGRTVDYDKFIVERLKEAHWYDDPPDPYNGELRPAKLMRQANVFYDKTIVENNMKSEWVVDDYGMACLEAFKVDD